MRADVRCSQFLAVAAHLGILAFLVPFLLPKPRCLPTLRASASSRALARECIVTGFWMMRPSATSFRMVCRELALLISVTSFGSSQIRRLPQPTTEAARRFCVRKLTLHPHSSDQHDLRRSIRRLGRWNNSREDRVRDGIENLGLQRWNKRAV